MNCVCMHVWSFQAITNQACETIVNIDALAYGTDCRALIYAIVILINAKLRKPIAWKFSLLIFLYSV